MNQNNPHSPLSTQVAALVKQEASLTFLMPPCDLSHSYLLAYVALLTVNSGLPIVLQQAQPHYIFVYQEPMPTSTDCIPPNPCVTHSIPLHSTSENHKPLHPSIHSTHIEPPMTSVYLTATLCFVHGEPVTPSEDVSLATMCCAGPRTCL